MKNLLLTFITIFTVFCFLGCKDISVYEKTVSIPKHLWSSNFKPDFSFNIKDTTTPYQIKLILRHSNLYNYNNIWIKLSVINPKGDTTKADYNIPLASNNSGGWLGVGMDDIFEHLIPLTSSNQKQFFKNSGIYKFIIEQTMRENPLQEVFNVGISVRKDI